MGAFWDKHALTIDAEKFRGQDQYLGEQARERFAPMLDYIRTLPVDYLEVLKEDDAFGVINGEVDGVVMSRDLHDSVVELDFLSRMCGLPLSGMKVLDIGAGYGRLAYRMVTAFPGARVCCTDPVAVSRAVCAKYLEARAVTPQRVFVSTPEELDGYRIDFDLAMNVHSWPECTRAEINGWLDWLVAHRVPRLFVVPHLSEMLCAEDGKPFRPDIERRGYVLEHHWRGPECWLRDFFLFRLDAALDPPEDPAREPEEPAVP